MTDDIVARLRDWAECEDDILIEAACADFHAAADEIERLKNQISHIIEHNNPQIEQANSYFKLLEEELARCNKIIDDYEEEHSRLRAALHEWDALIEHQYSGSREAMSDMTYAAKHTAHLLRGKEPWPEPYVIALHAEIERLRAALQEIAWIATPDHEEARHKATEIARVALGEASDDPD